MINLENFWAKVDKNGPGGCWLWDAAKDPFGYGIFFVDRYPRLAHKIAWELANRPLAPRTRLYQTCDTPGCVNPEHRATTTRKQKTKSLADMRGVHPLADGKWDAVSYQGETLGIFDTHIDAVVAYNQYISSLV